MRDRTSSIAAVADSISDQPPDLGPHSSPDGSITLLFTDVADSGFVERLGERRWYDVLGQHNADVVRLVEAYGGRVIRGKGDGFMVAFPSSHAGLHCAVAMQREFRSHTVPGLDEPLRIRIGLHSGFVIADADDFFGRNVVLAARIADMAEGGEILVSSVLKQYTETDPSFRFELRGQFQLKGLLGEHTVFAVDWAEAAKAG